MNDKITFDLSCTMYSECLEHLFSMKRSGSHFWEMRSFLATKPYLHPYHLNVLNGVVNCWETYFIATGRRYIQKPKSGSYSGPKTIKTILYLFFKLPLGKNSKMKWAFGLVRCKSLIKRLLSQSTYKSTCPQKPKSPLSPKPVHLVQTGLDCFSDLQIPENQLITGGKNYPVQKPTQKAPFGDTPV